MGRRPCLTAAIAADLAGCWNDPNVTGADLGKCYGVHPATISDWGRRLGLPTKPQPKRKDTTRIAAAFRVRRTAIEREQLKRLEAEDQPVGDELPTCFVCHGRSQTWDGHPSCRGKRAA
jgi:hypothetical protein